MTGPAPPIPHLVVTAAIVERDGAYLVTRRLEHTHLAGCWEFPGGKCEPGETHAECLEREMREELGVTITVGPLVWQTVHTYPTRIVELHFFRCTMQGEPQPLLGQKMQWIPASELHTLDLPPADAELVEILGGKK